MIKKLLFLCTLFCVSSPVHVYASLWNLFKFDEIEQPVSLASQIQKEINNLAKVVERHKQLITSRKEEIESYNNLLATLRTKEEQANADESSFINKQISLASQIIQVLTEIVQVHQQIVTYTKEHIAVLHDYKEDPEFQSKNFFIPQKTVYSLTDLQKVNDLLLGHEAEVRRLEDQAKKALQDLENRQKTQQLTQEEYEKVKKEQRDFRSKGGAEADESELSVSQQGALIDMQERLAYFKKVLADLRVLEIDSKSQLIDARLRVAKLQAAAIKNEYDRIKAELSIDKKDIEKARQIFHQQQESSQKEINEYEEKIDALEVLRTTEANQLNENRQKYNITDAESVAIRNWHYQPKTVEDWYALLNIGKLYNKLRFDIEVNKDLLQAKIEQEKFKITQHELEALLVATWYKIAHRKGDLASSDILQKEIKQYERIKADLQSQISSADDKKAAAGQLLNDNSAIAEKVKAFTHELKEQQATTFKQNRSGYNRMLRALKLEGDEASKRAESLALLIESYTNTNNNRRVLIKKIDSIIDELKAKTWIGVPPLWQGIRRFIPDMKRFFRYIGEQNFATSISHVKQSVSGYITYYAEYPAVFFSFLLQLIIILLVFLLLKLYLPEVQEFFTINSYYGFGNTIGSFVTAVISFIIMHLNVLFFWIILFLGIKYNIVQDTFIRILFYICSIPFWLYYAAKFIRYLKQVNAEREYVFASQVYQKRFFLLIRILTYSSIVILFFRQAFLQAPLAKSEVPTVLLAINFLLLQLCVIGIISRKQILSFIPQTSPFWQSIYELIERFYYLFLAIVLFVILMSNPYIGYGSQFFYFVSRIIIVALLIPLFSVVHSQFKRLAAVFFFASDEEGITKERFIYGRTAYGLFVIISFVFFGLLAFIIAANVWGYDVGFSKIAQILRTEIYYFEDPYTLKQRAVDVISLLWAALYIILGVLLAYIVNKFVLERIFDLLLVNIGVQNAVLTFSRYFIILLSIIIALRSIGQNSLLLYIFAVITALGFAIKEIISDFMAYFIILVQRPVKIGDFIKIDEQVMGIVRHITLRSVIVRHKNSTTVIVPNSQLMVHPIINWNYSRTFFAFDDIMITVPYSVDPLYVKTLMLNVLDNNINILKNPAPIIRLNNFTDNGFQFMIRGFLSPDKVIDQFDIASDVRLELVKILRDNGIKIASPTRILLVNTKDELPTHVADIAEASDEGSHMQ